MSLTWRNRDGVSLSLSMCTCVCTGGVFRRGRRYCQPVHHQIMENRPSFYVSVPSRKRKRKKKRRNGENQIQEKTFYNIVYKSLSLMPARLKFKKKKDSDNTERTEIGFYIKTYRLFIHINIRIIRETCWLYATAATIHFRLGKKSEKITENIWRNFFSPLDFDLSQRWLSLSPSRYILFYDVGGSLFLTLFSSYSAQSQTCSMYSYSTYMYVGPTAVYRKTVRYISSDFFLLLLLLPFFPPVLSRSKELKISFLLLLPQYIYLTSESNSYSDFGPPHILIPSTSWDYRERERASCSSSLMF